MERILILGGGALVVPAVETAREMGLHVTAVARSRNEPAARLADAIIQAAPDDGNTILREIWGRTWQRRFVAVFTAGEDLELPVSQVAAALKVQGISPAVAQRCKDKYLMKSCLARAQIPTPRAILCRSASDAVTAFRAIGAPVVIKPVNSCGSNGVSKVSREIWVSDAWARASSRSQPRGRVLVEEYVEGTTHTVEMIAIDGEYHVASVIDTEHGFPPYFVELFHVNPSRRSQEDQAAMVVLAKAAADLIGIRHGVAKVDVIFSTAGPQVMEMTARLSGGFHSQYTTPLALGTNSTRAALNIALRRSVDMKDVIPQRQDWAICKALFPAPGRIRSIRGVEAARSIPGVSRVLVFARPGDRAGPYRRAADRGFFLVAGGHTERDVWETLRQAEGKLEVQTN